MLVQQPTADAILRVEHLAPLADRAALADQALDSVILDSLPTTLLELLDD